MRPRPSRVLPVLLVALASFPAVAAEPKPAGPLLVGDDAPALRVGRWIKGTPVEHLDRGHVYVIELWTPTTSPCLVTLPALTDLAKRYPAATFVALGLNEGEPDAVEPFLRQMGDRFDVNVALDAPPQHDDNGVSLPPGVRDWFVAAGAEDETDMPMAFIVNADNVVAWIGRPMRMEAPLKAILAGTYDLDAARRASIEASETRDEHRAAIAEYGTAMNEAGNNADAALVIATVDRLLPKYPRAKASLLLYKFNALMGLRKFDEAYAAADDLAPAAVAQGKPMLLNNVAWFIVDNKSCGRRDLPRALHYAELAAQASDETSGAILDTLAKAEFMNGDARTAAATEAKALAICSDTDRELVTECLRVYSAAAATQPAK